MYGILRALNDKNLKPVDFRILSQIKSMSGKNGYCWPSYENLGNSIGVSRRTAIYSVQRLIKMGYLAKATGYFTGGMKQGANLYILGTDEE